MKDRTPAIDPGASSDLAFTVDACPVAQPRARHGRLPNGAPVTYEAPKAHPIHVFKLAVQAAARAAMAGSPAPLYGPGEAVRLWLYFCLPRPAKYDAFCGRGKDRRHKYPADALPHTAKPDADNLAKAAKDALKGIVWHDDSQVYRMVVTKEHVARGGLPGLTVLTRAGEKGVTR